MTSLHIVLAITATLFGIIAAGGLRIAREQRLVASIVAAALVLGNLASLLDAAPAWYSVAVAVGSVAAFAWLAWMLGTALTAHRDMIRVSPEEQRPQAPQQGARRLQLVRGGHDDVIDAEIVDEIVNVDEHATLASIIRDAPVRHVTARQIAEAGPVGAELTSGATYVASNLDDYVDHRHGTSIARAHRRAAGVHHRPTRSIGPEARLRRTQVRAAYAQYGPTPAMHEHRA